MIEKLLVSSSCHPSFFRRSRGWRDERRSRRRQLHCLSDTFIHRGRRDPRKRNKYLSVMGGHGGQRRRVPAPPEHLAARNDSLASDKCHWRSGRCAPADKDSRADLFATHSLANVGCYPALCLWTAPDRAHFQWHFA